MVAQRVKERIRYSLRFILYFFLPLFFFVSFPASFSASFCLSFAWSIFKAYFMAFYFNCLFGCRFVVFYARLMSKDEPRETKNSHNRKGNGKRNRGWIAVSQTLRRTVRIVTHFDGRVCVSVSQTHSLPECRALRLEASCQFCHSFSWPFSARSSETVFLFRLAAFFYGSAEVVLRAASCFSILLFLSFRKFYFTPIKTIKYQMYLRLDREYLWSCVWVLCE